MKSSAPLIFAAGAAFLLLSKKKKKPSPSISKDNSKSNENRPLPDLEDWKEVSEIQGALPPGHYLANDGDSVLLEVGMESTGSIGGMFAEIDGDIVFDIYVPLKSGFEIEYHLEGVRLKFMRPGSYKMVAMSSESNPPIWSFEVEG